ncbi:MAG: ABC transporter substrate-binding protein [Pseudonocardiaceae bacterium]
MLIGLVNAGVGACASTGSKGSVSLIGTEGNQFEALVDAFEKKTGIQVEYKATRAQDQVLLADVQNGTPPDVAALSSPGELAWYKRQGYLQPLGDVIGAQEWSRYSPQWQELARAGLDELYAVPAEVNLKSMVWFNKKSWPQPVPETLEQLIARSPTAAGERSTWCMGLSSGVTSGWPGTDWIEDILLQRSGARVYQQWAAGADAQPWNSPLMAETWAIWGAAVTGPGQVRGGTKAALLTAFEDAGRPMFGDSPGGCLLEHQASFMTRDYQDYDNAPQPGTDFDFVEFENLDGTPPAAPERSWIVAADMVVMFNRTPQAEQLVQFLASEEAQRLLPGEGRFSAHQNVRPDAYPNDVSRRIADVLTGSETLCFDASDIMPATMRNAFYRATQEYLSDGAQLGALLENLQKVRDGLPRERWLTVSCGQ